ncbi:conserved hypothetical protein [Talaromyces stipitatus ATCC 10500]|uniref:Reverse transcriptase Ty1/copia-type domain-containing protein n=1 Tax=Talaromyces stipitatus (strain ATCC 10500 / CBS 375.48 / QM 6759 / NRRL 1006) TaxID=441959 RepID=B8MSW3_TALSN|nr:uncharacterized protein TSTA_000940 [Talaromyces stipitatus ATCC 10500]EED12022.1 conserved hypothetical protein [Talaromyces stipitatus ATCC 10500]
MDKFEWFLNMRILRDREQQKIWICQDSYITKIAKKFGLTYGLVKTPISVDIKPFDGKATNQDIYHYQEMVGSVMYAAVITRIDIAKAVNKLAKHATNPSPIHIQQIKQVIQYLFNIRFLAIEYSPLRKSESDVVVCASDASFRDNIDCISSEGYLIQLYNGPVDWKATKQRYVTTSTTKAELRVVTEAVKRFPEPNFYTSLRHIDIYHHWLHQEIQSKQLHIQWVDTKRMVADGLTKLLKGQIFVNWRKHQGLVDIAHLL